MITREAVFNTTFDEKITMQYVYSKEAVINKNYYAYVKAQGNIIREVVFDNSNNQFGEL